MHLQSADEHLSLSQDTEMDTCYKIALWQHLQMAVGHLLLSTGALCQCHRAAVAVFLLASLSDAITRKSARNLSSSTLRDSRRRPIPYPRDSHDIKPTPQDSRNVWIQTRGKSRDYRGIPVNPKPVQTSSLHQPEKLVHWTNWKIFTKFFSRNTWGAMPKSRVIQPLIQVERPLWNKKNWLLYFLVFLYTRIAFQIPHQATTAPAGEISALNIVTVCTLYRPCAKWLPTRWYNMV